MARISGRAGKGGGWHHQSVRHSNARRTGRAGGHYANRHLTIVPTYVPRGRGNDPNAGERDLHYKIQEWGYVFPSKEEAEKYANTHIAMPDGEIKEKPKFITIKSGDWVWESEIKSIEGAYVKDRNGALKPATIQQLIKGNNLRRATGGSVLFNKDGEEREEQISIDYDAKGEPFLMNYKGEMIANTTTKDSKRVVL